MNSSFISLSSIACKYFVMTSAENYDLLIQKINIFIRKYHFNNLLRGLIFLGAGIFSAYVAITLIEYFGNFDTLPRTLLFYFFILLNVVLVAWLVVPPLLALFKLGKTLTHDDAAEIIGRHFTDVNDKLLNTLQLRKQAFESTEHRALIEAGINQKIETLKPVSFPSAVNIRENNRYLKYVIPPAAIICILAFAAPSVLTESTKRIIRHNDYFAPVAPFNFLVLNKELSVVQGEDFKLDLKLTGDQLPSDIYIETAAITFKLEKENISRFHYLFSNLQRNTVFRLSGNGFKSIPYEIRVNLKPALLHFDANLIYPAYLHKKNETVTNAGDLTIPAGTVVNWKFHTQNATSLIFKTDNKSTVLAGTGVFEHRERILKNTIYTLDAVNNAVNHSEPAGYRISVINDEPPVIAVQEKPDSVSMKAFYFNGRVQDDHGFTALNFHYRIGEKNAARSYHKPVKADFSGTQASFFYFWNLKELGIKPGDVVSYYFEVADNNGVSGPIKARSPERTLNVPDAAALAEELNAGTQVVKQKMQSAVKLAGQIEKSAQKLNQTLLDKNNLSFDEKKQVEELLQKRKDLNELVKDIQNGNKKNLYNRQESQQQNEQLLEEQKQIEQLFDNVLDDKTKNMLEKLQQLLERGQKDATRDELSKMQMDNKSLKKELDRMLELYKKLDFEQKLNQNINQLNQLADDQKKLAEQTGQPNSGKEDLQQQQQKLNNSFQDIKKSLTDLQETNAQSGGKQQMENPEKDNQAIEQQMEQSSEELKKNNKARASKTQQQAAKQMKQLANKMQQEEAEGSESENAVDARQLRELLKSLVNSSFQQEKIMQTLKGTNTSDPNYIILAQNQKDIKDNLKTAEDSLYNLSKRIPQIQSTVNKEITGINTYIDKALENLGDRKTAEANSNQQYTMTAMNNLALMLSEALQQLQNMMNKGKSGKGKGSQPSLSQLSKMQQQLNKNMQNAREQMQQQGGEKGLRQAQGQGMSEQLARLAREQQTIRQALQKLDRDKNKDGSGGVGSVEKFSKEMEQTENDLVNRRITDETLKRQQQIQTRLLEAEKAEQQRGQDSKRESRAANELPPGYVKALQNYEQIKTKQTEQIKTIPSVLNLYYKQKIKSYFDQLNAK